MANGNEERILIDAGLSEEQAIVYQALLEKGPQKASALASWTGVKRSLVYKILGQLENMGLVETKGGTGTVATFSPNHPSLLMNLFEQKEKEIAMTKEILSSGLGQLTSKFNLLAGKPNVQFFEGDSAIEKILGDYPKKDKEIRQWVDMGTALKKMPKETINYKDERVKKEISKRIILSETAENINYAKNGSPLTEFRIIKKELPTGIQVYDDKVTILTLTDEKQIGFVIEDKIIAETMKNIFDTIWEKTE